MCASAAANDTQLITGCVPLYTVQYPLSIFTDMMHSTFVSGGLFSKASYSASVIGVT
jgi:hypothetical protein